MSEPSSSVPDEIADADVEESSTQDAPPTVELDIDQDKVDAWDAIKGDYQVDPDAESAPDAEDADDAGKDGAEPGPDDSPEAEPGPDDSPEAEPGPDDSPEAEPGPDDSPEAEPGPHDSPEAEADAAKS